MKIPMNIDEIKKLWEEKIIPTCRMLLKNPRIFYLAFIILVSLICILPAEKSSHRFRNWYYDLTHKVVINKGVEYAENGVSLIDTEKFLTYYRFQEFGAANPKEIDVNAPMVALTFDDGPNPDYTKRIIEILEENYSRATFFVVGTNAELYSETLQMISESGSEIGNHSYNHKNLTEINEEEVEKEIDKVNRAVKKATGEKASVIRPPYGAFDDTLLTRLDEPAILWDMDTEDWNNRNAQTIADKILSEVKDGDIILMHDIYDSTAEAVAIVVPKLKELGYQIVTVSELAHYKGKTLEAGKVYGGFRGIKEEKQK